MKSITLALAMSLFGSVAMAQMPPAPPKPVPAPPAPGAPAQPAPPATGTPAIPTPSGPPEGMIVETPNGFFLVRPGEQAPQRLDLGQQGRPGQQQPGMAQGGPGQQGPGMAQGGPGQQGPGMAQGGPGDEMDDMADDAMPPHPPRPHKPPHPPESKAASFRIHSPNLNLAVKCPDDEPMKACVDAVSQLLDKTAAQPR